MAHKIYTYANSLSLLESYIWSGSEIGDTQGYIAGPPSIVELADLVELAELAELAQHYDLFITDQTSGIATWVPAGSSGSDSVPKGHSRIVRLSQRDTATPAYSRRYDVPDEQFPDEHAECGSSGCAIDYVYYNKTQWDPYLINVQFLEDSVIGLHSHPCGALYNILLGEMCFIQSDQTTECAQAGESYWTAPDNIYTERAKKDTLIQVLGFQCAPIFY